jgi:hypothetical protein
MTYIVEDNFDFFKELNEGFVNSVLDDKCMISHLPLTSNYITLPCNHSFNYLPLYTELCLYNNKKNINCPYCRKLSNKLIPFIPLPNVKRMLGVNYPDKDCLPAPACSVIIKMGVNKGLPCGGNGIVTDDGTFCLKHIPKDDGWTPEMDVLSKKKSVIELKEMLREKGMKVGGVKKELVKRLLQ